MSDPPGIDEEPLPIYIRFGRIWNHGSRYWFSVTPERWEKLKEMPRDFDTWTNQVQKWREEDERAMVAAAIIELQRQDDGRSKVTVAEVAEQLNVSDRLVYHAAKVIHEGTEQDVKDIMSGEKKVRAVSVEL